MKKTAILTGGLILLGTTTLCAAPESGGPRQEIKNRIRAQRQQQRQENQTFRESIKDLTVQEKAQAAITHRNTQYQENAELGNALKKTRSAAIKNRLDQVAILSEDERTDILNSLEQQYQDAQTFRAQQHEENIAVLEQIANDPDISAEEAKFLLQDHRLEQKEQNREFRQTKRQEIKAARQGIREKIKDRDKKE